MFSIFTIMEPSQKKSCIVTEPPTVPTFTTTPSKILYSTVTWSMVVKQELYTSTTHKNFINRITSSLKKKNKPIHVSFVWNRPTFIHHVIILYVATVHKNGIWFHPKFPVPIAVKNIDIKQSYHYKMSIILYFFLYWICFFYLEIEKKITIQKNTYPFFYRCTCYLTTCWICRESPFLIIDLHCCSHSICENCFEKVDRCPFCRKPFF